MNDGYNNYTYDADGNNITTVQGGNTAVYTYDAANRRTRVQTSAQTTEFVFDAMGRRVSAWSTPHGGPVEVSIFADSQVVAIRTAGETRFQHLDYLGTRRRTTGPTGSPEATFASLPFGDGFSSSGPDGDWLHFAGLDVDSESNTHHGQFRQYSQTQGRWLSPDPYDGSYRMTDPQSLNRYTYVKNNALGRTDSSGLCEDCDGYGGDNGPTDGSDGDGNNGAPGAGIAAAPPYVPCAQGDPNCTVSVTGDPDPDVPTEPTETGIGENGPGASSGGGSGTAPSTVSATSSVAGKSPARRQCEANAQAQYDQAVQQTQQSFGPNLSKNARNGAFGGLIMGCVAGATTGATAGGIFLGPEAAPVTGLAGCLSGGEQGAVIGGVFGAVGSVAGSLSDLGAAYIAYKTQMNACSTQ